MFVTSLQHNELPKKLTSKKSQCFHQIGGKMVVENTAILNIDRSKLQNGSKPLPILREMYTKLQTVNDGGFSNIIAGLMS